MKKIIIYSLMLLTSVAYYSCSDKDENLSADISREFMPMFRCDNNTGKGSTDPYNCHTISPNSVYLCWYTVDNCVGYEIQWGILAGSQGDVAWQRVKDAGTIGDTIITNPQYGYGDGRQWADYMNLDTEDRYATPTIIGAQFLEDKEDPNYKTSFRVYLDRSTDSYSAEELETYTSYTLEKPNGQSMKFFQTEEVNGEKVFKIDYLEVKANPSSPTANVPEEFRHYELKQEDWDRGYVYVYGLDENSVYNVNVYDEDIPYAADACYNGIVKRTKGDPGAPILIPHVPQATDTLSVSNVDYIIDISSYDACKLNAWFTNHMTSNTIAENQVYYLEGGKNYFIDSSIELYKGFTLATNPEDLTAGKGKAKIFMSGMGRYNNDYDVFSCNFAFGRAAQAGESASVPLEIDTIKFQNIDFSVPLAYNKGDNNLDADKKVTANYWFNDINSNAMGYILNSSKSADVPSRVSSVDGCVQRQLTPRSSSTSISMVMSTITWDSTTTVAVAMATCHSRAVTRKVLTHTLIASLSTTPSMTHHVCISLVMTPNLSLLGLQTRHTISPSRITHSSTSTL